jgi:nicotinamidase-related amidase
MPVKLLGKEQTGLVIVDIQKKLMDVMGKKDRVLDNTLRLIHLAKLFDIPIIMTEQYPKMIGPTLPEIREALPETAPIVKIDFNCCAVDPFMQALKSDGLINIILTGVESHICVLQTCLDLLDKGYIVHVPRDAVDSRTEENWLTALNQMEKAGAVITSTETVIFQILKKAGTKEFKEMLRLIK